jgi:DNA repair protein RecO (recombination protein O)
MHLVKIFTADSQKNEIIFNLIQKFFILLNDNNWVKKYIFWELDLFKVLGYDLEFDNLVNKEIIDNQYQYVSISTKEKKIVPNFLIDKNQSSEDLKTLLNGLKLVGDYLEKSILRPNNLTHPISRLQFINTLK